MVHGDTAFEVEYAHNAINCLPLSDIIRTVEQIIRHAPEFGIYRELGGNIFFNFVLLSPKGSKNGTVILTTTVREICSSKIQYLFEFAINRAINHYLRDHCDMVRPFADEETRMLAAR
jgi:hypothetical protein